MVQILPHYPAVAVAVFGKFEQKLAIMTPVGKVIQFSRKEPEMQTPSVSS